MLDQPARLSTLETLAAEGVLDESQAARAGAALRASLPWGKWADRLLLLVGTLLLLSGIVFFFAYNWEAMGRFMKLGLIEGALAACLFFAWRVGLERLVGKILVTSASVLVGVFLAVFGQIYQTGADAWTMFAAWSVLVVPWVAAARFPALVVLWIALLHVTLITYVSQVGDPFDFNSTCLTLGMLNAAALALSETVLPWMRERWVRGILLCAALVCLQIPATWFIIEPGHDGTTVGTLLAYLAALAGAWAAYRIRTPDLPALSIWSLSACVGLLTAIGKGMFSGRGDEVLTFFAFGMIVVGVFTAAVTMLRRTARLLGESA